MCPDVLTRAAAGSPPSPSAAPTARPRRRGSSPPRWRRWARSPRNIHGANLPNGVVSALLDPHADGTRLVAEIDERWLPAVMAQVPFRAVVLLNLSRDQIDRMAEVRSNAVRWRAALSAAGDVIVVANADDPIVAHAVPDDAAAVWVAAGMRWRWDAMSCPACGGRIDYGDDGDWACRSCPHRRPSPTSRSTATRCTSARPVDLALALPGEHTRSNAAMALAAAQVLGVAPGGGRGAFATVHDVDGRYRTLWATDGRLFLGKNPAGWLEVLEVLDTGEPRPLVLVFNANQPDGRDPSWLWDVPVERLRGREVIVAGERATGHGRATALRRGRHRIASSLDAALDDGRRLGADVLATYTAFWQVKGALARAAA